MSSNLEYFLESIGDGKSFNLWVKKESRYYNQATLFFRDNLCGNQWDISDLEHSVSYDGSEITDEIEIPLKEITNSDGEALLKMEGHSPQEVFNYFSKLKIGAKNDKSI